MSTSGIYANWLKVQHPNEVFPQMKSGGFQKPFFFGGSQVPINLGLPDETTKGEYIDTIQVAHNASVVGRGIHTTSSKHNRIRLPKNFKK